jgi:radical SAM additional 4Fe4S-binding domain
MMASRDFHVFSKDGQSYLFLSQPVAVFKIDDDTRRVLQRVEQAEPLSGEFEERRGEEAQAFIEHHCRKAPPARALRAPEDIGDKVAGLYLFLSQECNLKCAYCYGDEGEYGRRGRMDAATLEHAFDTFFAGGEGRHFATFFGGEPLMNFPLMKTTARLSERFRREGKGDVSLGIVTNGTFYNKEIGKFFRDHINDVTFSLDGPPDLTDSQRLSKRGGSVYRTATENIRKFTADPSFNWAFRSIVTRAGHDRVAEIYRHLENFRPGGIGVVNVDVPEDNPLYLDDGQYWRFVEQIVEINREGLRSFIEGDQPVAFEYPFYILFYFISRRHALYHCNAGTNLLAVTAEGDVYPCHRFVGTEEFNMGNVANPRLRQSERYREIRQRFVDATVDNREGCRDCWARYLCGGSCAKYSHAEHGDIAPPVMRHCLYIKTVIEEILPDIVALVQSAETRQALMERLKAAVSNRYGSRGMEEEAPVA